MAQIQQSPNISSSGSGWPPNHPLPSLPPQPQQHNHNLRTSLITDSNSSLRSPSSSVSAHSSLISPSDNRWTSFDDSDNLEFRSPDNESQNLLDDMDAISIAESSNLCEDDPYIVDDELRHYYRTNFDELQRQTTGKILPDGALEGSHPRIKDFFQKSKLSMIELSKVWHLSDVNKDGFLNYEEFCAAMHLVVMRVKGNIPVPDQMPPQLMPSLTPPRQRTPESFAYPSAAQQGDSMSAGNPQQVSEEWTKFTFQQRNHPAAAAPPPSGPVTLFAGAGGDIYEQHPQASESPKIRNFTNSISQDPDTKKAIVQPVALKARTGSEPAEPVLPRAPPTRVRSVTASTGAETTLSQPPQAKSPPLVAAGVTVGAQKLELLSPKGQPPPPPPPRPQRHMRSASLDLSKQSLTATADAKPAPNAPSSDAPVASNQPDSAPPVNREVSTTVKTVDQCVQTEFDSGSAKLKSSDKRQSGAPLLDFDADRLLIPGASDTQSANNAEDQPGNVTSNLGSHGRCENLRKVNSLLESRLTVLLEKRVALEHQIDKLN